jgi:copper transport protein
MSRPTRLLLALAAIAAACVAPGSAYAHAYLIKTVPAASGLLETPPRQVGLTYDEAVEPRFAIISVTDAAGKQQTSGPVMRSEANPDTLTVSLRPNLPEGWYLIYWRAISVDGHPVQGAFTYAVGPNPGPAPQFQIPSISATATSTSLLIARWAMFLTVMVSIGLFVARMSIIRPLVRRAADASLRTITIAFVIASVLGLIAIPAYLDFATANDSLRSVFAFDTLVPLYRVTAFGRGYVDMAVCFALFCIAAWISLWVDRPRRELRSIAELASVTGALLAAAAALVIPGGVGHAGQTSPRGVSLLLDWLHLVSGSIWLGGLVGLLVLWRSLPSARRTAGLAVAVPRFSNVALPSVVVLLATGTLATIIHMPAVDALWKTGYGVAILVKIGLLSAAVLFAATNRLRAKPGLLAAGASASASAGAGPGSGDRAGAERAGRLLRRMLSGEAILVTAAVFAAAVLSSLAPPPPAFALQNSALAQVGPGRVAESVQRAGYRLQVLVSPNQAAAPDSFALRITKGGRPLRGASVTLTFNHTEMEMPAQEYQLSEKQPGVYSRAAPALVMVGKWALTFQVTPRAGPSFTALILDQANG